MPQQVTWSFGPFQFDPKAGRLTKSGHRIKLQPKAAALLSCLLESPGDVVTREQLQKALWPVGTYVDFDLGIKSAVKKLRDALGDRVDEPVYIQTLYGEGFRFVAAAVRSGSDPQAPTTESALGTMPLELQTVSPITPAPQPVRPRMRSWAVALAGLVTAATIAVVSSRTPGSAVRFRNRDWVLIARFENRTGEALLDGTMEFALASELTRSGYVNVAPPERIGDTLRLMRQDPGAPLTESLARQVALRDGQIRAVLAGRVEKFGTHYVLIVKVVNPSGGETLAVLERHETRERLPDAARSVADDVRRKLGESEGKGEAAPLERATTPSLAALRTFSEAMKQVNARQWAPAADTLEMALREDARFALAHIYAAHCYSNLGQDERAASHYKEAFRLSSGVTDRERLFITGSYYERYLHDDRSARAAYEALTSLYPDDYWGINNLVRTYASLGMTPEEMKTREHLVALRPTDGLNASALITLWWYYKEHPLETARAQHYREELLRLRHSVAMPPTESGFIDALADLETAADRWANGDVSKAATELDRVGADTIRKHDDSYTIQFATANLVLGRVRAARTLAEHLADREFRSEILLHIAMVTEDRQLGTEQLNEVRTSGSSAPFGYADAVAAAWLGDLPVARQFGRFKGDLDGLILLAEGHPQKAVQKLKDASEPIRPEGIGWDALWRRLMRAEALEQMGQADQAISELTAFTRPAAANFISGWPWAQCRVKLAELYRKVGRPQEATKVEEEIRHYMSAADADHPILVRLRQPAIAATKHRISRGSSDRGR